ncbi:MAG: hemagglutinin, partial [Actinomycetota bacterium]|nr:hemagglutinin [Actinomycetota bacterium]
MATELRLTRRVDALFKASSGDFLLREQIVTDPAQVISEYVEGKKLSAEEAAVANHLLYAVLSNKRLTQWMREYARRHPGSPPSRAQFAKDFATAVAGHGDPEVVAGLVRAAAESSDVFVAQADLIRAIIGALGGRGPIAVTEMSPGGTTEMSPGGTTEMSPGAVFSTEMSPGGTTEMSPGG